MNCESCGKSITEYTFVNYAQRCIPCFQRMPLQRVRLFFTHGGFDVLVALFLIPFFLLYEIVRLFWQMVRPVPFKRDEIYVLMTPHYGTEGAKKCIRGFRYGFVERPSRHCGCRRKVDSVDIRRSRESLAYIAGREDGAWLRRAPKQLQHILARRCSAPVHLRNTAELSGPRGRRRKCDARPDGVVKSLHFP